MEIPCLSAIVVNECILALVRQNHRLSLVLINEDLEVESKIATFNTSKGFILDAFENRLLLSIDNTLVLIEDSEQKVVLKSEKSENFFWHASRGKNMVFVQEYGELPTGIFVSEDFENWRRVVVNTDLDRRSRHFHYIIYDPYREWLIATLGDGCFTRVVVSEDLGNSWNSLYKGPWQFVPVVPLRDKIVFGMDSGIAKGGIGIYYPDEGKWNFIFLKWVGKNVKHAQFCDLKFLSKGLWIASLGTPQAVMVSSDLRSWYPLFVESFNEEFNHKMLLSVGRGMIACSTGKTLLIFNEDDVENAFNSKPLMVKYKAYRDKLIGYGFLIKHSTLDKIRR
jgi:hypothetical protein